MDRKQGPTLKGFMSPIRTFSLYPEGSAEQIGPEQWQLGEGRTGNGNRSVLRMLIPEALWRMGWMGWKRPVSMVTQ